MVLLLTEYHRMVFLFCLGGRNRVVIWGGAHGAAWGPHVHVMPGVVPGVFQRGPLSVRVGEWVWVGSVKV